MALGYHQIPIEPNDVMKTTFQTRYDHYEFVDKESHEWHLRVVLERLREHKFYERLSKCSFWKKSIGFLGHIVSGQGVSVDPDKIKAIQNWLQPRNSTEERSFLGITGYYRKFMKGFASLAQPMTRLTGAPVLVLPEVDQPYVVYMDASILGLGCVLTQHRKIIAYASRKLKKHEGNFLTHNMEMNAVVFTLKIWRSYLYGTKGRYLWKTKFVADYNIDIAYNPDKANLVADTLSRRRADMSVERETDNLEDIVHTLHFNAFSGSRELLGLEAVNKANLLTRIRLAQDQDENLNKVVLNNQTEYQITKDGTTLVCGKVSVSNDRSLERGDHDGTHKSRFSIHPGAINMYHDLKRYYHWIQMKVDVAEWVAKCPTCQLVKAEQQVPKLLIPKWKWDHIAMNFVNGFSTTRNRNDAVWVIVDRLTKSAHFMAIKKTDGAGRIVPKHIDEIVRDNSQISDTRIITHYRNLKFWSALPDDFKNVFGEMLGSRSVKNKPESSTQATTTEEESKPTSSLALQKTQKIDSRKTANPVTVTLAKTMDASMPSE
ncbi:hypothetical protein N665_0492s0007 [Sinapis alba]|nr:hypothetical protein N665_0492s0007 [Sinapis alba]